MAFCHLTGTRATAWVVLLLGFLQVVGTAGAAAETWVFYRSDIPLYLATINQLKSRPDSNFVFCPTERTSASFLESGPPAMAIALGEAGLERALAMNWHVPILAALVDQLHEDSRLISIDAQQPHALQFTLLKKLVPRLESIWYPFVADRFRPSPALHQAARDAGLKIIANQLRDPRLLPDSLRALETSSIATLLPPDPGIMNEAFLQPIFLAAFQSQKVVVGFSESLVKRGAAFAYVISPDSLAADLADLMGKVTRGARVGGPSLPFGRWSLILNTTVLDKLRLPLPDEVRSAAARRY